MLDMRKQGKIKVAGVSNWQIANLKRMAAKGMELPEVNQVEAHIG
jgi:diketogulonate reductase-like aldo/keto reductase